MIKEVVYKVGYSYIGIGITDDKALNMNDISKVKISNDQTTNGRFV